MRGRRVALEFQTAPGAACSSSAAKPSYAIYADAEGSVRLGLRARNASASETSYVMSCKLNGATVKTIPIHVTQLAGESAPEPSAPPALRDVTSGDIAAAKTRLGFDFTLASKAELIAHDLPPRPIGAEAYAGWLRAVTSPTKHVLHQGVPIPVKHQAAGNSRNWSGYVVTGSYHEFETASGEWYVPQISTECGDGCLMSVWPGVGGYGTGDIIQAGSDSYLYGDMCSDTGCSLTVDAYNVWYEYFPGPTLNSFAAGANDDLWCEVWANSPTSASSSGSFYCKDNTTGWVLSTTLSIPSGATFTGQSVDWILEAPRVNNSYFAVPNFGTAHMWGAYGATTADGQWFGYSQRSNIDIAMFNPDYGHTIATSAPWNGAASGIQWTWYNYF